MRFKILYKIMSFFLMQSIIFSGSAFAGDAFCPENVKPSAEYLSPQITINAPISQNLMQDMISIQKSRQKIKKPKTGIFGKKIKKGK